MRILKPILFLLAIFVMVELSFRVYLYGPGAFHPGKMDSFTQVHDSGFVRTAESPAIYYELRPNLDVWYKGVRFVTNSAGLRDQEYSLQKPANVFRIAVLGSSWTMGSGIEFDNIWHAKLEQWLNAEGNGKQVELINFAVDQYGLGQIIATLEQKALAYDPDLILIAVTNYTPHVPWSDSVEPYVVAERRHPFFDLHSLRVMDRRLQLGLMGPAPAPGGRMQMMESFPSMEEIRMGAEQLEAIGIENDVPIALVKLAYNQSRWQRNKKNGSAAVLPTHPGFIYIDVTEQVRNSGYERAELNVSIWDSHPNRLAHELMAKAILQQMLANNLLPESVAKNIR